MIYNKHTIGINKKDILSLINIINRVNSINKNNNIDNDTKARKVFATLENYSTVVDDCDIIKRDLVDIFNVDNINIKIVEEL